MRQTFPIIVLVACSTSSDKPSPEEGVDACSPSLSVAPELSFGEVSVLGDQIASADLTIRNTGDCAVSAEAVLDDPQQVFAVTGAGALIAPGEEAVVSVSFAPDTDLDAEATLTILSDVLAPIPVALSGSALAPVLSATPSDHDFGTLAPGCEDTLPITLHNIGREDLIIEGFAFDTASTGLAFDAHEHIPSTGAEANGALPWTLAPDASLEVYVSYGGTGASLDSALLEVSSNDPVAPTVALSQRGEIDTAAVLRDTFTSGDDLVDVVIAVNASSSMSPYLADFSGAFSALTGGLGAAGLDYRLAVVSQDDGTVIGSTAYISPSTADVSGVVSEMLSGTAGADAEKPLTLLERALLTTDGPGGWLRSARLHLVAISDNADQSTDKTWDDYVSSYQSVAPQVRVHAIGGDYPAGCGSLSPLTGAYEATIVTDGIYLSLCEDMSDTLSLIADEIRATQDVLHLSAAPIPETIVVTVDGVESTDWSLDHRGSTIVFDPQPADGAEIEVSFVEACL